MSDMLNAAAAIAAIGVRIDRRGWAPATAGNYSVRLADGSVAITVSGARKGRLTPDEVMRVDVGARTTVDRRRSGPPMLHLYE